MWFDYLYEGHDWWLESSTAAEESFAAAISDPRYLTNAFGALTGGLIAAP
jgi:hypothetical protein